MLYLPFLDHSSSVCPSWVHQKDLLSLPLICIFKEYAEELWGDAAWQLCQTTQAGSSKIMSAAAQLLLCLLPAQESSIANNSMLSRGGQGGYCLFASV